MNLKRLLFILPFLSITLSACDKNKNNNNNEPSTVDPTDDSDIPLMDVSTIKGSLLNRSKNPLVKWEGRYEYKAATEELPSTMYLYHAATGFTVDFIGTKLEVSFVHYLDLDGFNNVNIYYDYAIDDETLPNPVNRRFHLSKDNVKETITLCEGLTNKQHTVKCLKMSEAKDAYTGVYEIKTDGKFVYRDVEADNSHLKFMFICASGGSGYGALAYSEEGPNAKTKKISNSSALHSFNYLTARRFNADVMYVATSGWGVRYPENKQISKVLDKAGVTPSNDVNGALTTGDWNKDKYIPDVIIFNIGGNDTKNSAFNATNYKARVVEMVRKMHSYYPLAKMLWTHTVSNAGGYAISELTAQGIMSEGYIYESIIYKVGHGEVGSGEGTYGASEHYSLKTQIDSAKKLTEQLQDLGFTPTVDPVSFADFNFEIEF